ncbi:MAG: ATP-dependent Clp protease ATP-binding subunit ClpX [Deltaproteobacteria bacterium]|nr:ATP-dependent Clp protease ATP-binding subunit ClpX [Deltaproteobacteria bacterium]
MEISRKLPTLITPKEIFRELDRYVIGQERSKKAVAIAAYSHVKRVRAKAAGTRLSARKTNALLIGPTGCGKTHIARTLARILDVPFVVADATEYTEAGYYGKDVEVMIGELLLKADMDVEAAQSGIVFVDEIDKIARRSHGAVTGAGSRDIGGEGVQQSLLKLLEGRQIYVPTNVTQHWSKHDFESVDTTDILFICAGTFSDLHLYSSATKNLGFGGVGARVNQGRITEKDLLRYGILAETLGRLPVQVQMAALTDEELLDVLLKPPDSLLKEYDELLRLDGVTVEFEVSGLKEIVNMAQQRETGARGMRAVLEEVLSEVLFKGPELAGETVVVDEAFVTEQPKNEPEPAT